MQLYHIVSYLTNCWSAVDYFPNWLNISFFQEPIQFFSFSSPSGSAKYHLNILSCFFFAFRFDLPCLALPCLALPCLALTCLAMPCLAMPCLALPCLALPCLALPCLALTCLALPCLALPCLALPCLAMPWLALPCHASYIIPNDWKLVKFIFMKQNYSIIKRWQGNLSIYSRGFPDTFCRQEGSEEISSHGTLSISLREEIWHKNMIDFNRELLILNWIWHLRSLDYVWYMLLCI